MTDTKRTRRSVEERIKDAEQQLAKLKAKATTEVLRDDPKMARIQQVVDRLHGIQIRAKRTVNGQGRGQGAEVRIQTLQAEIADLTVRLERDQQVLLVIDDAVSAVEQYRDAVLSGQLSEDSPMPTLPTELRHDTYRLTPSETAQEAERKAREEFAAGRKEAVMATV